jgi:predicted  nucleic acid-binding Zn-ribbon protein
MERMVAEVRSYTDDVLRVVKEEAKSRVQMDVENSFAPLARDIRAEAARATVRIEGRVGELEFLIRDLKTELHSELKSVAQAMATADSSVTRTRAKSPGKSEAQMLISEMKAEFDATLMEV